MAIQIRGTKRKNISTRERMRLNNFSKIFWMILTKGLRFFGCSLPRTLFFREAKRKFLSPIWSSIAPQMKGEKILLTSKRAEGIDEEANLSGGDKEFERMIKQQLSFELASNATNRGLKDLTNWVFHEVEFTTPHSKHKIKEVGFKACLVIGSLNWSQISSWIFNPVEKERPCRSMSEEGKRKLTFRLGCYFNQLSSSSRVILFKLLDWQIIKLLVGKLHGDPML